ncbi:uncharacterized protein [Montipora foliosa]|uniref:uncharacterized protein n=1 Tax=Montipora foliosa TaxID=591990 RepID=UPI0035F13FE1
MLPYLAASGHNLYVKCARLYLQSMSDLRTDRPDVYRAFTSGLHVARRSDRFWAGLSIDLVIEKVLMRNLKTGGGLTRGRGLTEQQRLIWLLSMPACAETNHIMQELTGVQFNSGEQNKDMSKARQIRDMKDTVTILRALAAHNPFSLDTNNNLRNIMNGVNADSNANADTAKSAGEKILSSMNGKLATDYSFKRSAQAVTMASKSSVKIADDQVQVDPQLLFQRLIIACDNSQLEELFQYELCTYPTALFDSPFMLRQPQKPALADALWAKLTPEAKTQPEGKVQHVLDGGALLHRVPWPRGSPTYKEVCDLYCTYVQKKYGRAIVVFDGYNEMSAKAMTQQRRASGKAASTVTFTESMSVTLKKDNFLSNPKNKQRFLSMLSKALQNVGCITHHANGDADLLIVKTAVESARTSTTVLVGDDTDLLVLLCYHASNDGYDLYFRPEPKANARGARVWHMKKVKDQLGEEVCRDLLFLHAITGCDTISRLYGVGKATALKKLDNVLHFKEQANVFSCHSTVSDVVNAGEKALVSLFGGKPGVCLNALRYQRYFEKLASKTSHIEPQNLPPTAAAARFHSLRVYLQVKQWQGEGSGMSMEDWGWKVTNDQVFPVATDLPPAPESLLQLIRCNCSSDCSSMRCICRKNGMQCSPACGQCKGSSCTNSSNTVDYESEDSEA